MSAAPAYDHWGAALDELELTVTVAERLLDGQAGYEELQAWNPPQGLGPIPPAHFRRTGAGQGAQPRTPLYVDLTA